MHTEQTCEDGCRVFLWSKVLGGDYRAFPGDLGREKLWVCIMVEEGEGGSWRNVLGGALISPSNNPDSSFKLVYKIHLYIFFNKKLFVLGFELVCFINSFLLFESLGIQCVSCYTCAFVLMWCLFVDNSRQTTSSVPWHRASKYDLKLIYIWTWNDSSSNSTSICACVEKKKGLCLHLEKLTVWISEGGVGGLLTLRLIELTLFSPFLSNWLLPAAVKMTSLTWAERTSCLLHFPRIPDSSFYKMAKNPLFFVVLWFQFP